MEARRMETRATRVDGMEHRWGRRIACGAVARLSVGAGVSGTARLRDVSLSGAFIETALQLPTFAQLTILVRETEVQASVVRIEACGVGVEWIEMEQRAICPLLGCKNPCAQVSSSG